jgi:hypothetical protein
MAHELEKLLNAPAEDIMDAIIRGFRAQIDVKGKLAELYLYRYLQTLESENIIGNLRWIDVDGMPDFEFDFRGKRYLVECKNLRNEMYKKQPSYKVEIQKTRNSKDGSNTRSYTVDYFDILAVCMFNQTSKWDFLFIKSKDLETDEVNPNRLKIMQRCPIDLIPPWKYNILDILYGDEDK